ncbi:hypothetical protein Hanom_Chr11g01055111 [Helianthus anomalus]
MLKRDSETSARRGLKMDGCCGYLSSFSTFYLFLNNIRFSLLDLFIVVKFLCDKTLVYGYFVYFLMLLLMLFPAC